MSFAQEVKDFIAGWQAVSEIGYKRDSLKADKEYRDAMVEIQRGELDLKRQKAEMDRVAEGRRAAVGDTPTPSEVRAQARFEWEKEDRERAAAERAAEKVADELPDEEGDDEEEDVYTPAYAEGGLVEALETSPRPKPKPEVAAAALKPTAALPTDPQSKPPAPVTSAGKPEAPKPTPNLEATKIVLKPAEDAISQVGQEFITDLAKPPAAVGGGDQRMTLQEFDTMLGTIDPEKKLPKHLETAAVLGAAFNTVKDPQKRYKLARGVLRSAMEQSQILGGLVPEALKAGKVNEACRLFNDACNKFPTGHEVIVTPIAQGFSYEVKDADGKVVMDGNLTPEELLQMSGKVADGSAFIEETYRFYEQNKKTKADPDRAIENVETAAGRLAGITETLDGLSKDDPNYKVVLEAQTAAIEELNAAKSDARRLKVKPSEIRSAQKDALAVPYELPAPPADDRNIWERNAPEFLGGKPAPGAIPTQPAPAPVTPQGNAAPAGKPLPPDIAAKAKDAIAKGADRAAVIKRLQDNGFSTDGL